MCSSLFLDTCLISLYGRNSGAKAHFSSRDVKVYTSSYPNQGRGRKFQIMALFSFEPSSSPSKMNLKNMELCFKKKYHAWIVQLPESRIILGTELLWLATCQTELRIEIFVWINYIISDNLSIYKLFHFSYELYYLHFEVNEKDPN